MPKKEYTGSCYIGVVGGESENGQCRDTIEAIKKRKSDKGPFFVRATKGFEARQQHLDNWYNNTKIPFLLLLDHDMYFPEHTLERMRKHKLPYVSGFYLRRMLPSAPIWYHNTQPGQMPMMPMTEIPEDNKLYPLGASGWGCILLHRDVVTATRKILKGEKEIIEDDMDIMPYDLYKIRKAIKSLEKGVTSGTMQSNEAIKHINTLKSEIIPLRVVKDNVGSDIRFPFFAKLAGYQLVGDSGVLCWHHINYPIKPTDYTNMRGSDIATIAKQIMKGHAKEIERLKEARKKVI